MKVLVVPTIRETSLKKFLDLWLKVEHWDEIIIVEDNPHKSFDVPFEHHYSWNEIEYELGFSSWIISKRDSAIRSFGFLKAHQIGAKYIFTLDDDCLPCEGQKFCEEHIKNLEETPKWTDSVLGFRTRGLPYQNFGKMNNVAFSMGLWEGVPDLDAIHMLTNHTEPLILPKTRIMPKNQYFPFCGMNFAFKREFAVLTYFPLMGKNSPFGRFDDIWFGIICKKICDHLDLAITVGEPYIYHSKASNAFDNLVKEAPGIKFNETFWKIVDSIKLDGKSPTFCMKEIGAGLLSNEDDYISRLGKALDIWANHFKD